MPSTTSATLAVPRTQPDLSTAVYEARGIKKRYGGVQALDAVDFAVRPGEVHALLGANGAGKSTLVRALAGAEAPDEGELRLSGQPVRWRSVADAGRRGVAVVSQELNLFPDLDVLSNLFLLDPPRRIGAIAREEMRRRARPVLETVGLSVPLEAPLGTLPLAARQLVEVARALLGQPKILLLDEPNSALKTEESRRLLEVIGELKRNGVAIIYVSHFLEEVHAAADRITILRDGRTAVAARPRDEMTIPQIVEAMVDLPASAHPPHTTPRRAAAGNDGLVLEGITVDGALHDVSLRVDRGEIVGLAGLEGSGVHVLVELLFGVRRADGGTGRLPGAQRLPRNPHAAVRAGVALVPADRKRLGVMLEMTIAENMAQVRAGALRRAGFRISPREMASAAARRSVELAVKAAGVHARAGELSGGNQQKVVFGKWLEADPSLVVLDDPTRGVDIASKAEMHAIVRRLAESGRVVVVASSDLAELAELCDRVVVLFQGRVRGQLPAEALSEHTLLAAINGAPVEGSPSAGD
jgi:ABC-type sugar transport system ATPase subunit